jgi:hypothetical protein
VRHIVTTTDNWRKSSYSGGDGNNCVEIATRPAHNIAVRDSKSPACGILTFPAEAVTALLDSLKGAEPPAPRPHNR